MFETIAQNIPDQQINFHDITLIIRRLDLVHPQISGNKFFKLKYNFLEAKRQGYQHILSFGGAIPIILLLLHLPHSSLVFRVLE